MSALGWHSLIELTRCPAARLARVEIVRPLLLEAVRRAGGTIVTDVFHPFSPEGVSGVVLIAESHVTIHTWPEHGYAAVDVFSCHPALDHEALRRELAAGLGAQGSDVRAFARGPVTPASSRRD